MKHLDAIFLGVRVFFVKVSHWEYWSSTFLYLPVLPYLFFLWIKTRSVFFFNSANPGIKNGGFLMESKWAIDQDAPSGFFPKTILVSAGEPFPGVVAKAMTCFEFPFIAKPDVGGKGRGVAVIKDLDGLRDYHDNCPVHYILQEKISYPMEAGIFYVRLPGQKRGMITGIVEKKFVKVTGDGLSTVRQLLLQNPRYLLQIESFQKIVDISTMNAVLTRGQETILVEIGNHARGCHFINAESKISPTLTSMVDTYCRRFPGFYFGRLDIRFQSWEELQQGLHFAVIELNGAGSEPTHIYDPNNSLWYVWMEICRHWRWMAMIATHNNKHGVPFLTLSQGVRMFIDNFRYNQKMKKFGFSPTALKKIDIPGAGNILHRKNLVNNNCQNWQEPSPEKST